MDAHEIYLAGGCFWGTEAYLKKFPGIIDTEVGYVNASVENPSYEDVCTGATNAAEAVKVTYDADVISPSLLLQAYLRTIDPSHSTARAMTWARSIVPGSTGRTRRMPMRQNHCLWSLRVKQENSHMWRLRRSQTSTLPRTIIRTILAKTLLATAM